MSNRFYVYALLDPDTKLPFYIGKGINRRISAHYYDRIDKPRSNKHKINKINKILANGKEPITEIVADSLEEDVALIWETLLICIWGRSVDGSGILTNLCSFGHGRTGLKHTEETKRKISEKNKNFKHTKEAIEKIRQYHLGKQFSEESRLKMSIAKQNMSDETKEKLRQIALGRPKMREETRKKLGMHGLGKSWYNNGVFNKRFSQTDIIPNNYVKGKIRTSS